MALALHRDSYALKSTNNAASYLQERHRGASLTGKPTQNPGTRERKGPQGWAEQDTNVEGETWNRFPEEKLIFGYYMFNLGLNQIIL